MDTDPLRASGAATVAGSAFRDAPISILIVDDEPKNLTVLETVLADPGYRLVRAESADKALLALVTEEFALLILDIRMPEMTGFELAQIIKERKKTALVPIIFLSAYYGEDQQVLEGYGAGGGEARSGAHGYQPRGQGRRHPRGHRHARRRVAGHFPHRPLRRLDAGAGEGGPHRSVTSPSRSSRTSFPSPSRSAWRGIAPTTSGCSSCGISNSSRPR